MTLYIASIVEGQTEQACLERLLQRAWAELLGQTERLQVLEPFHGPRDKLIHSPSDLSKTIEQSLQKLYAKAKRDPDARKLLLVLLDAESDCPATLAPQLFKSAREIAPVDVSVSCVMPKRMLENWIVAGASTLGGINNLPNPLPVRDQFEQRSGAAWLDEQLRSVNKTRKYKKVIDASEFISRMDLYECRANSPSFDKLCRELEKRVPAAPTPDESDVPA